MVSVLVFLFAMSLGCTIGVVIMAAVAAGRLEDERREWEKAIRLLSMDPRRLDEEMRRALREQR